MSEGVTLTDISDKPLDVSKFTQNHGRDEHPEKPNFDPGDRAEDREDDDPDTLVVLGHADETADEHVAYNKYDGTAVTVAEDNPEYPNDGDVVLGAFVEDLDGYGDADDLLALARNTEGVRVYAFPARRLRLKPGAALKKIRDELQRLGWDTAEVDRSRDAVVVEKFGEHLVRADGTVETDRETFREKLEKAAGGVV